MTNVKKLFVVGGLMASVAACEHGDPVSNAGGTLGHAVLVQASPIAKLPGGSATVGLVFGGFDPAVRDWLGRKQPDATRARRTRNLRTPTNRYTWINELRDATPATRDPRTPAPTGLNIANGNQYFELYQPEGGGSYPNAEYWELYAYMENVKPSTPHEIAFVHRRLTVNGLVDHVDRITNGTVAAPDALGMGSGTKATVNSDWSGGAPVGCSPFPGVTSNPFVVSTDASAANGHLEIDKCWQSGNGIWTKAEFDTQAKGMVGRADDVTYSLPNYNYIEVWEGAFGTGTLVARMQIAQDLDPSGAPVKDAYPPFPAPAGATAHAQMGPIPAVDAATSYPVSATVKATLPGALSVPSSVVATLTNVQQLLDGVVYKAWFMNGLTGAAVPAVGQYVRTENGNQVENVAATSTFAGGKGTITFSTTYDPAVHGAFADSLNFLVFTKEASASATTPSISQPLWVKIFKFPPASSGGPATFGNFNRDSLPAGGDAARKPVPFTPQGTAAGGVLGDTVTVLSRKADGSTLREKVFVGSQIELRFTGLQRPPKGYEYVMYLRQKPVAASGSTPARDSTLVQIGGLLAPDGSLLTDADVAANNSYLGPQGITVATLRYDVHSVAGAQLCDYDQMRLYVVPKGGNRSAPLAMIFQIKMPDRVLVDAVRCQ
jgi:hypothetical protein